MAYKSDGVNNSRVHDSSFNVLDDSTITMFRTDAANPTNFQRIYPTKTTEIYSNLAKDTQIDSSYPTFLQNNPIIRNLKTGAHTENVNSKAKK